MCRFHLQLCQKTPGLEVGTSTSLLYHGFSLRGYKSVRTQYQDGKVRFSQMNRP